MPPSQVGISVPHVLMATRGQTQSATPGRRAGALALRAGDPWRKASAVNRLPDAGCRGTIMSNSSGAGEDVSASLDVVVDGTVMGWARDPNQPDGVALLQLRLGTRRFAPFRADVFRPDLRDAGLGTGHHGFAVPVPRDAWEYARRTGDHLTCFPFGQPDRVLFSIDNDERLDAPAWLRPLLLDMLSTDDDRAPLSDGRRPPRVMPAYAPLFAPATAVAARHAPGLFPFAEHVRQWKGVADRFAPELIGPDLDHFVRWYIEDYAAARAPLRAPLSAAIVGWLNEPVVIGGRRHAPTRGMLWSMGGNEQSFDLNDDQAYLDLAYWWACERAPALAVEDCLVPRSHIDILSRVPEHWEGQAFPLSNFMERALVRRPALSRFEGMQSLSARVTAYMLLAMEALGEPGLLRFVPRSVHHRLFGRDAPLFDALAAGLLAGDATARPMTVANYRALLADGGFDLDALAFLSVDAEGNRCEAARLGGVRAAVPVDVQVVGPFGKASGVSRAARLSRAALATTGLSVSAFDCDVDNRQPDERMVTDGAPVVPARINLFHLNADMLPLAYAYLPDLHGDAYAIGFFFWELDQPAECHRLALDLVDEIWVASDYNRRCFASWTDKPVINVGAALDIGVLPPPAAVADARHRLCRAGAGDFVMLATFDALSFVSRKNPLGLVRAFLDAFSNDPTARLVLKTHNTAASAGGLARRLWDEVLRLAGADDRILILDETLSFASIMALTASADCYVSLHRAEGLGFGLLEAMRLGVPVLCTAYSGNLEFCDDETAWLVAADEVAVGAGDYAYASPGHRWAEPRHAAAVAALQALRSDDPLRRSRAEAARARAIERYGIEAAGRRYAARIGEILAGRPVPDCNATPVSPRADGHPFAERRPRLFPWTRGRD